MPTSHLFSKLNEKGVAFTLLLIIFLVAGFLIAAGLLVQLKLFGSPSKNLASPTPSNTNVATSSAVGSCDTQCQDLIDSKIAKLKTDLEAEIAQNKTAASPTSGSTTQKATATQSFVYFGVTGSTQATDWVDLPGSDIKFNITDYPGAKGFYFQASLQSDAAWLKFIQNLMDNGWTSGDLSQGNYSLYSVAADGTCGSESSLIGLKDSKLRLVSISFQYNPCGAFPNGGVVRLPGPTGNHYLIFISDPTPVDEILKSIPD